MCPIATGSSRRPSPGGCATRAFLAEHGAAMKGFARKEAAKYLAV
jgi:hypothetical protein